MNIDLACGNNKYKGYRGVDITKKDTEADIIHDLTIYPWPFEDNSIDKIICSHYIEHEKDLIAFMNELYRVMKVGATAGITGPYYKSIRCWQDPTHVRAITENSMLYFNQKWLKENGLQHYPITANFTAIHKFVEDEFGEIADIQFKLTKL